MKRLPALLAGTVLLALAACAPGQSGSLGPAPTGIPPPATRPPPSQTPPGRVTGGPSKASPDSTPAPAHPSGTITLQVWFTHAGKIFPTRRSAPATVATSRLALTQLLAG